MEAQEHVLAFGKSSLSLLSEQLPLVHKLTEVGNAFLLQRARRFIASHAAQPILVSRSSDGTPMTTKNIFRFGTGEFRVLRKGGIPS